MGAVLSPMIRRYPYEALPRIAGSEKNLWRQLRLHLPADVAGLRRWSERCLASADVGLRRLAAAPERAVFARRRGPTFLLRGSGELQCALTLDGSLATSILRRMLGTPGDGPRGELTAGEWGLLAFGLAWLFSSVQTACPWSVDEAPPEADFLAAHAADAVELELELEVGDERGVAWILLPRATLAALPLRDLEVDASAHSSRVQGVLLSLAVEAGRATLPLDEAMNLAAGDLLLFGACPAASAESYAVWLKCGRGGFAATLEGEQLTLDADFQGGQPPMKSEGEDNVTLVEGLDVELVVELGRVEMSAAEVMTLGKGDVVTLQRALVKPVDVRVGGKLIGRAELVDVDGEAGIRIVELYDGPATS